MKLALFEIFLNVDECLDLAQILQNIRIMNVLKVNVLEYAKHGNSFP